MLMLKILMLLVLPIFLYSYNTSDYLRDRNILKNKEIELNYQRYVDAKEERIKLQKDADLRALNRQADAANEMYYRKLKTQTRNYNNANVFNEPTLIQNSFNTKDFKSKPQLKLGELHILGITSIEPFKDDKVMIKAANGTFALPKDKFDEAEKINFTPQLMN